MVGSAPARGQHTAARGSSGFVINGCEVEVRWRVHARARRVKLSIDPREACVIVTLPPRASRRRGEQMLAQNADWVLDQIAALPERIPFADGAAVPVLGHELLIRHRPEGRRGVWAEDGEIYVSGRAEHLGRRIGDWLRKRAIEEIAPRAQVKADTLGRAVGRVRVREMRSRWGSCSTHGDLAFCWRLVLSPEAVLDYVVAHEVAHLAVMNHGPAFWRTVARLVDDVSGPRAWLRAHGNRLHRYG